MRLNVGLDRIVFDGLGEEDERVSVLGKESERVKVLSVESGSFEVLCEETGGVEVLCEESKRVELVRGGCADCKELGGDLPSTVGVST